MRQQIRDEFTSILPGRGQPIVFDETEFVAVRWFAFDEAPLARAEPHMQRFLAKLAGS